MIITITIISFFSDENYKKIISIIEDSAARVWARITRVIIPATARYWRPIFGNISADDGPVLGRI